MAGDREKVLAAGMNDHIAKPILVADMFKTMAKWIAPAHPQTQALTAAEVDDGLKTIAPVAGIDTEDGLARTQHNLPLYQKLLLRFSASYQNFDAGFAAACADADATAGERYVHTLKGIAASLGAKDLASAAFVLEQACKTGAPIAQPLADTRAALQLVLAGLEPLQQQASENGLVTRPLLEVTPEQQMHVINQLLALLGDFDTDALEQIDSLQQVLPPEFDRSKIQALRKAIEKYDFEQAIELLRKIKSDLSLG